MQMHATRGETADFAEVLAEKRAAVWPVIESCVDRHFTPLVGTFARGHDELASFHRDAVMEYPRRLGKYLRPALVLLTCGAMDGREERALVTAAAMQLSEDWLLVHDDWEDGSTHRRGKPTLHRLYGPEVAVNAGDALHMLMWRVLADNAELLGHTTTHRLLDELYRTLSVTAFGQAVELKWTRENRGDLTESDWFFIADGKTSSYTIAGPMRLGAIVAGASDEQLEHLSTFGRLLGRCFQLVDDLLDVTSDFDGLKGHVGNDVYEGKRTLLLVHLLDHAPSTVRERVLEVVGRPREQKSEDDVRWVIARMEEYGSVTYARAAAGRLATEARRCFDERLSFLQAEPARSQLTAGIDFLVSRRS